MLYGVTWSQAIVYYRHYWDDKMVLKLLIDTVHEALITHVLWFYLISKADSAACLNGSWSLTAQAIPSDLDLFIVRCFYIVRVWKLGGRKSTLLVFIPAVLALIFGILFMQEFARFLALSNFTGHGSRHRLLEIFLSVGTACDLTSDVGVTANMYYLLYKARKDGPKTSRFADITTATTSRWRLH
ncbi:hypothetical protein NEOLEDRAFT_1140395 [Neolentinus lepideus HHB14362 ss-1]|uniref:Uncharacterized protein n=1 Tax=Neolentinus lepideus HHB14362 ss-1 TaxID=1314782 RepID=A0A165P8V3_9AGAM|nr:hypothetical protein NEOLEDRAFT_1140395 [Neolentinus lepideus HHB14362 ss-1]